MENYIGEIRMYAGTKPPANWAICDGSLISVNEYYELFTMIGTTFGGDGFSTFGVPDMRGRAPICVGAGPGLTPIAQYQRLGAETSPIKAENLPAHTHILKAVKTVGTTVDPTKMMMATGLKDSQLYVKDALPDPQPDPPLPVPPPLAMAASSITSTGNAGNITMPIVQPYMAINFIVSLKGIM